MVMMVMMQGRLYRRGIVCDSGSYLLKKLSCSNYRIPQRVRDPNNRVRRKVVASVSFSGVVVSLPHLPRARAHQFQPHHLSPTSHNLCGAKLSFLDLGCLLVCNLPQPPPPSLPPPLASPTQKMDSAPTIAVETATKRPASPAPAVENQIEEPSAKKQKTTTTSTAEAAISTEPTSSSTPASAAPEATAESTHSRGVAPVKKESVLLIPHSIQPANPAYPGSFSTPTVAPLLPPHPLQLPPMMQLKLLEPLNVLNRLRSRGMRRRRRRVVRIRRGNSTLAMMR